jgi:class 3 adenylate cyclase/glutamine cyclotransferase
MRAPTRSSRGEVARDDLLPCEDGTTLRPVMKERGGHVLATVLFTDIVDSSTYARELGDARWRALLGRHHAMVRNSLKRHHGREIDNAGDGFFAVFSDQVDAIRCACEITDNITELGIELRAGCHVGQAEVIGRKLSGVTIATASRVMSEAGPSEVLVSSMLKDLVPASGFTFVDRGQHRLKGIEGEWHLYSVTGVDGSARLDRPDPEEMARRRQEIKPLPIIERRWGRIAIAAVGLLVALGAVAFVMSRPQPIEVQPNSLVQIDPATNSIVADMSVAEPDAAEMAFVPTTHEIWVLSHHLQQASAVNTSSHEVVPVSVYAGHADPSANGYGIVCDSHHIWVTGGSDGLEEFNPVTKRRIGGAMMIPGAPAILSWGFGRLWVTLTHEDRVLGINPQSREKVFTSDPGAGGIANITGDGSVWTAKGEPAGRVAQVDPRTGDVKPIDLPFELDINGETLPGRGIPSALTYALGSIWVSDNENGRVFQVDPRAGKVLASIEIGGSSPVIHSGIAELDGSIWVASPGTMAVVRIDPGTGSIIKRIPMPYPPKGLIAADGSIWVTVNPNPV